MNLIIFLAGRHDVLSQQALATCGLYKRTADTHRPNEPAPPHRGQLQWCRGRDELTLPQTLTNGEDNQLRDTAIRMIRHSGIVGEANTQYALDRYSKKHPLSR